MLAIDWSHIKDLTVYDGKRITTLTHKELIKFIGVYQGEESIVKVKSTVHLAPPLVVIESGCPVSFLYSLVKNGINVCLIKGETIAKYRKEHSIDKTDKNDTIIIYKLASEYPELLSIPLTLDDKRLQVIELYHYYRRFQSARVAQQNQQKAFIRHFGNNSKSSVYETAIKLYKEQEIGVLKGLQLLVPGIPPQLNQIKGLGNRIWIGILATANPMDFPKLGAYLKFCGLKDTSNDHQYNRHAKMLYHMLAEETMRHRDPMFRSLYDKCKTDIAVTHPGYSKMHIHNATLNRVATFLAKEIYRYRGGIGN